MLIGWTVIVVLVVVFLYVSPGLLLTTVNQIVFSIINDWVIISEHYAYLQLLIAAKLNVVYGMLGY